MPRTAGLSRSCALRHTFARWFQDHGREDGGPGRPEELQELQELLGHSDGRMVGKYAQVRSVRLRQVASRLKGPMGAS